MIHMHTFSITGSIKRRQEFRYKIPLNLVPKTKIDRNVSVKGKLS